MTSLPVSPITDPRVSTSGCGWSDCAVPVINTGKSIADRLVAIEQQLSQLPDSNRMNLVVFGNQRDRLMAAFVIATGAAACGMEVTMFFTFWATAALRKSTSGSRAKSLVERAFGWMLPRQLNQTKLSQLDMCGLGRLLMSREMSKKNMANLDQLLESAADLGVKISVCEMSMNLMGIRRDELIDYPDLAYCGAASLADMTTRSNTTLFI